MGGKPSVTLKSGSAFMDMFKSTDPDRITAAANTLPLSLLTSHIKHMFRPYSEEKKQAMVDSITRLGILEPLIVRPTGEAQYEIIAGYNRAECAALAGLTEVPVRVMELDDDQAILVMIETNLCQRENLLPSERAWAYRLRLEVLNRQGARVEDTCGNDCHKLKSRDEVGAKDDIKGRQVSNYIRLTHLIPELLDMVDGGDIIMNHGVDLSYLQEPHQALVLELTQEKAYKLTNAACTKLKEQAKAKNLTDDAIKKIMLVQPPKPKKEIKIPVKTISKYNIPQNKVQEVIVKALDLYFAAQNTVQQQQEEA